MRPEITAQSARPSRARRLACVVWAVAGAGAALQGYVLLRMYLKPHERQSELPVHDHWGVAEDAEATADAEEAADIAKAAAEADGGIAHKGNVWAMATFQNGPPPLLGDGLRMLFSEDGFVWEEPAGAPIVLRPSDVGARVLRDPSVVFHAGLFHLVYTSDLCVKQVKNEWRCLGAKEPQYRPKPRIGYAYSNDLRHWHGKKLHEIDLEHACSVWAPELSELPRSEGGGFLITFSATVVKGECPPTFQTTPHRAYWLRAKNTEALRAGQFTAPKRLVLHEREAAKKRSHEYDDATLDESVIDLFPIFNARPASSRNRHVLLYKSEHNRCAERKWQVGRAPWRNESCTLVLRLAVADKIEGPWRVDAAARGAFFPRALSRPCVEGPTALPLGNGATLVLFDAYRLDCVVYAPPPCGTIAGMQPSAYNMQPAPRLNDPDSHASCAYRPSRKGFGGMISDDFVRWRDVSHKVYMPVGYKHGTAVRASRQLVCKAFDSLLMCQH